MSVRRNTTPQKTRISKEGSISSISSECHNADHDVQDGIEH